MQPYHNWKTQMANKDIFCNLPWQGLRVYHDGSYGICCTEKKTIHDDRTKHNIAAMTPAEWYNSQPLKTFRQKILGDEKNDICTSCYQSESVAGESIRYRHNFKSVIFTKDAFEKSYQQSPWFNKFEASKLDGATDLLPRHWHLDLGNECNLACKMCNETYSSKIAKVMQAQGTSKLAKSTYGWHRDPIKWKNFLTALDTNAVAGLHVIGGEPTLIKKFVELIDHLISNKRFDVSLSFATNGTFLYENQALLEKLDHFLDVDISVSIETADQANDYIRQGSNIEKLLSTIENIQLLDKSNMQIILQSTIQALNISRFAGLARYAWKNKIILETQSLVTPAYLRVDVLPLKFRLQYIEELSNLEKEIISTIENNFIQNGRGLGTLNAKIARECSSVVNLLNLPLHENSVTLQKQLVAHCEFWDKQYDINIKDHIPELYPLFKEWGYDL